jgi:hypothetical protein
MVQVMHGAVSGSQKQVQLQRLGECLEVPLARDEGDIGVDAALRNQRVSQTGLSLARQSLGA